MPEFKEGDVVVILDNGTKSGRSSRYFDVGDRCVLLLKDSVHWRARFKPFAGKNRCATLPTGITVLSEERQTTTADWWIGGLDGQPTHGCPYRFALAEDVK